MENILSNNLFRGNGDLTGSYPSKDNSLIAITSNFKLYGWEPKNFNMGPSSTPIYLERVTINEIESGKRFATLDTRYRINDVAFHSSEPIVAIATGAYDGGFVYEGELLIWNYQTNALNKVFEENRQVLSVYFDETDTKVIFDISPSDDEEYRENKFSYIYETAKFKEENILKDLIVVGKNVFPSVVENRNAKWSKQQTYSKLKQYHQSYEPSSPIWTVKWLNETEFISSSKSCFLEKWKDNCRVRINKMNAIGMQIIQSENNNEIYVNTITTKIHPQFKIEVPDYYLMTIDKEELKVIHKIPLERETIITHNKEGQLFLKNVYDSVLEMPYHDFLIDKNYQVLYQTLASKTTSHLLFEGNSHFYYLTSLKNKSNTYYEIECLNPTTLESEVISKLIVPSIIQQEVEDEVMLQVNESYCFHENSVQTIIYSGSCFSYIEKLANYIAKMDIRSGEYHWIQTFDTEIVCMCIREELQWLVFSTRDGRLGVLSIQTGEQLSYHPVLIEGAQTIILSLDILDETIVAGTHDGFVLSFKIKKFSI